MASDVAMTIDGPLRVKADIVFEGVLKGPSLECAGISLGGDLDVQGIATFQDNVTVQPLKTFTVASGASSLGGSLTVAKTSQFNDNVTVSALKTLTVTSGATLLGGGLTVTGASTLNGKLTVNGDLDVGGTLNYISTEQIVVQDKVVQLASTTGTTALLDGAGIKLGNTGQVSLLYNDATAALVTNKGMTVAGSTALDGNVTVAALKTLTVTSGVTVLGGSLTVTGSSRFDDNVVISALKTLTVTSGATNIGGSCTISGTAIHNGSTTFNDNITVAALKSLTVTSGTTTLGGSVVVTGATTHNDNVVISANKSLSVTSGETVLGGSLSVTGNVNFAVNNTATLTMGTATITNPIEWGGDATATDLPSVSTNGSRLRLYGAGGANASNDYGIGIANQATWYNVGLGAKHLFTAAGAQVAELATAGSTFQSPVTAPQFFGAIPVATVVYVAWDVTASGKAPPSGFLFCNGAPVSRTTYAVLFSAVGTTFGAGDGSTTFVLPDLRGVLFEAMIKAEARTLGELLEGCRQMITRVIAIQRLRPMQAFTLIQELQMEGVHIITEALPLVLARIHTATLLLETVIGNLMGLPSEVVTKKQLPQVV
jgi:Phage Tail Collar Domain